MRILRDFQVAEKTGVSRSTVWRKAKADSSWPKPIKVSEGCTGWVESEVDAFLQARIDESRKVAA